LACGQGGGVACLRCACRRPGGRVPLHHRLPGPTIDWRLGAGSRSCITTLPRGELAALLQRRAARACPQGRSSTRPSVLKMVAEASGHPPVPRPATPRPDPVQPRRRPLATWRWALLPATPAPQAISVTAPGYTGQAQQTSTGGSAIASVMTGYRVLTSTAATAFTGSFSSVMYWAAGIICFKAGA
jgi:hypothetical protein